MSNPDTYTFEANRFYCPDEIYSSGSGLSISGLTLVDAVAQMQNYTPGNSESYSLSVHKSDGVMIYHRGENREAAQRSMRVAYKRRYGQTKLPADARDRAELIAQIQRGFAGMRYGDAANFLKINPEHDENALLSEIATNLNRLSTVLVTTSDLIEADKQELNEIKSALRGLGTLVKLVSQP